MLEIPFKGRKEAGILDAGGDALVHDHAQRHQLLAGALGRSGVRHRLAHTDKHTGGAELVAVVEDEAGIDGGKIRDEQAGVEGAEVDDLPGPERP